MPKKALFDELAAMELTPMNDCDAELDCGSCSECNWSGKLSECPTEEEGTYESGYYTAVFCPVCEDGGCIENFYPSEESIEKWNNEHGN